MNLIGAVLLGLSFCFLSTLLTLHVISLLVTSNVIYCIIRITYSQIYSSVWRYLWLYCFVWLLRSVGSFSLFQSQMSFRFRISSELWCAFCCVIKNMLSSLRVKIVMSELLGLRALLRFCTSACHFSIAFISVNASWFQKPCIASPEANIATPPSIHPSIPIPGY